MTKYFKVLGEGFKTVNGFDWKSGLSGDWIEEKDFEVTPDEPCGKGIHVWKDFPRYNVFPYLVDHTFEVEVKGDCLGQDKYKARFRAVRLINVLSRSEIFFPKADLRSANLRSADLSLADLSSAIIDKTKLSEIQIKQAIF